LRGNVLSTVFIRKEDAMTTSTDDGRALAKPVFKTLLLAASQQGMTPLPLIEQAVVVEIVAGVLSCVAGADAAASVPSFEQMQYPGRLEQTVNHMMQEAMAQHGSHLHPELVTTLLWVTRFEFHSDYGEKWYETPLRWKLESIGSRDLMRSLFELSVRFVREARKMRDQLPDDIRQQCQAIGAAMRPYVARDKEYIRTHYRW
jgi:hypothetical protein